MMSESEFLGFQNFQNDNDNEVDDYGDLGWRGLLPDESSGQVSFVSYIFQDEKLRNHVFYIERADWLYCICGGYLEFASICRDV